MDRIAQILKGLTDLGLEIVHTERQARKGTLVVHDPITNTRYSAHISGYVRRSTPYRFGEDEWIAAPINDRGHDQYGSVVFRPYIRTTNPEEQARLIRKGVVNYRKHKGLS